MATDAARANAHLARATTLSEECGDPHVGVFAQMLHAVALEETGESESGNAVWEAATTWIETSPVAEQMALPLRYHRAVRAMIRGDRAPIDEVFAEFGDSHGVRILRMWARRHLQ